jgi:ATP-dependent exoDNAse (exonuclease V) beta subunit
MRYPEIISASAGSGKTYTVTDRIYKLISSGKVTPDRIIATTFTIKAANELKARIRSKLIVNGQTEAANLMNEALIGTINSVCLKLLQRFAIQAGISPMLNTIDSDDKKVIVMETIGAVVDEDFLDLATKLKQFESSNSFVKKRQYEEQIEQIISKVRANDLSIEELDKYGEDSVKEFFSLFPSKVIDHEITKSKVLTLLEEGLAIAKRKNNSAKSAKEKLANLQDVYKHIKYGNFKWSEWAGLSEVSVAHKDFGEDKTAGKARKTEIAELIGYMVSDSLFRSQYETYVKRCFGYAKEVIETYTAYKAKRGLLDFIDQESQLHKLLKENTYVQHYLKENFSLVVVDEFQDVSPLQLDIFLRITQLVDMNIWVGDPKQSIYAFRGADPELMTSVMKTVPDAKKDQLGDSYRSRAALIDFSNAIFSDAFAETMPQKSIVLSMADKKDTNRAPDEETAELGAAAINYWKFQTTSTKNDVSLSALTNRLKKLLESKPRVFDKETSTYRAASYGDVAILCRTNARCQRIGQLLSSAGMPVSATGFGLIAEPEIIFISALLKLLIYPYDSLAKAEVLLYGHYEGDQAAMVNDRLKAINARKSPDDKIIWQEDNKYLVGLAKVKQQAPNYSISKCIETVVGELEIEQLLASWGNVGQRLANVDALLKHATEYQEMCNRLKTASSIAGFLTWMKNLHKKNEDMKGEQSGDVIQVMTYHQSKGLEWGIVVLWDLDYDPKDRFFGVNVVSDSVFDPGDSLKDRELRLMVKPFSRTSKPVCFMDPINATAEMIASNKVRDEEEKRLFYVAVTRARDYLYLCTVKDNLAIPDLVSPQLNQLDLPDGVHSSDIIWDNRPVQLQIENFELGKEVQPIEGQESARLYFASPLGPQEHPPLKVAPSSAEADPKAIIKHTDSLHPRFAVDRKHMDSSDLGDFIHQIYCAYNPTQADPEALAWLNPSLVYNYYNKSIDSSWLLAALKDFHVFLKETYVDYKLHHELPVQYVNSAGQYIEGYVDLVVEVGDTLMIIDYKTFIAKDYNQALYEKKALEFSGQLSLYAEILEKSFAKKVDGKFIYFVFEGKMMEVAV